MGNCRDWVTGYATLFDGDEDWKFETVPQIFAASSSPSSFPLRNTNQIIWVAIVAFPDDDLYPCPRLMPRQDQGESALYWVERREDVLRCNIHDMGEGSSTWDTSFNGFCDLLFFDKRVPNKLWGGDPHLDKLQVMMQSMRLIFVTINHLSLNLNILRPVMQTRSEDKRHLKELGTADVQRALNYCKI